MCKNLFLFITIAFLAASGCVEKDIKFTATSAINSDGRINRTSSLKITLSGERDVEEDSANLHRFYIENFGKGNSSIEPEYFYSDSTLDVMSSGILLFDNLPSQDYYHQSDSLPASNRIELEINNSWLFKDYHYKEIYTDPVDTAVLFPIAAEALSKSTGIILSRNEFSGLRERENAYSLMKQVEEKAGIDMLRKFLEKPDKFEELENEFENIIKSVSDSLSGMGGVKLSPDSLNNLLNSVYEKSWDTVYSRYPGLFGSYGFLKPESHLFAVYVEAPGFVMESNADTTVGGLEAWFFENSDFFAKEYLIEVKARKWNWLNSGIFLIAVIMIAFFVFRTARTRRFWING